jgi:hypothetical protein
VSEQPVPTKPTEVSEKRGVFDILAVQASTVTAGPGFFVAILGAVLVWLVVGPLTDFSHSWIDTLQVAGTVVTLSWLPCWRTSSGATPKPPTAS